MDLARKMTRAEVKELSDVEKKERKRLQKRINGQKIYQENREEILKKVKKYTEEHKEEVNKYQRQYTEEQRLEKAEYDRNYREEHKLEKAESDRNYREKHKEEIAEYEQTPFRKKSHKISNWVNGHGLQESKEDLDIIYELYLHQELCYSCDVKLTRDGVCSTQAVLDHDHITHRFRQICCRACNNHDSWMKYWC